MTNAVMAPVTVRLKELREARGWTQSDLARESGVPQPTISRIEKGTSAIDLGVLERLANALDIDAALLIQHKRGRRA
jgi:transcriptional regulator with XRE-family HTH domain